MIEEKEIEKLAEAYAEEENSAYTNDFYGFINGFKKAVELMEVHQVSDWSRVFQIMSDARKQNKSELETYDLLKEEF